MRLVNRSGNRPPHERAAAQLDESIAICRAAGFRSIRLRGDTDFSQTKYLDDWNDQGVKFCFGLDATAQRQILADDLPDSAYQLLKRPANARSRPRARALLDLSRLSKQSHRAAGESTDT